MILQIASAEQYAQAGDVILSPEVAGVTRGLCSVDPLEGNNARLVSMSESLVVNANAFCPALVVIPYLALVLSGVLCKSCTLDDTFAA